MDLQKLRKISRFHDIKYSTIIYCLDKISCTNVCYDISYTTYRIAENIKIFRCLLFDFVIFNTPNKPDDCLYNIIDLSWAKFVNFP